MADKKNEIQVGSLAPDFRLQASTGGEIGLADYRGKKNVVLFFIREHN
jgi:peroxiredoxin